jgi:hypothetical protein
MTSPHRRTLVELDGDTTELQVLLSVAPACDCAIVPGPGDTLCWLSGTKIDDSASSQQARDEANKILALLNGLARLENPEHRNVDLADCVSQNGRLHHCASPGWRSRAGSQSFVLGLNRFKENVEDPRHSGMRAVHGVPKGRLTSAKMTEGEGLDFVVRLLDAYLEKNPP